MFDLFSVLFYEESVLGCAHKKPTSREGS